MRNLWARVKPEDLLDREGGVAKGLAASLVGDRHSLMNIVTARKMLSRDTPDVVGRWNLRWLAYPDIDTYFTDPSCVDEDGNQLPKLFWERLLLLSTLSCDEAKYDGQPLWQLAATTTPKEFVDTVLPSPDQVTPWVSHFFRGTLDLSTPAKFGDEKLLDDAFALVGKSTVTTAESYELWVEEARARAYAWTPYAEAASQPSSGGNVIHVSFGRP